jgi:hypothetical protein
MIGNATDDDDDDDDDKKPAANRRDHQEEVESQQNEDNNNAVNSFPIDVVLLIAQFVQDRKIWRILITLCKEAYRKSWPIGAPWKDLQELRHKTISIWNCSYQFSLDSKALVGVDQTADDMYWSTNMRVWQSRLGPLTTVDHKMMPLFLPKAKEKEDPFFLFHDFDGFRIFNYGRYVAIYQKNDRNDDDDRADHLRSQIISVYDLGDQGLKPLPSFHPNRCVDLLGSNNYGNIVQMTMSGNGQWVAAILRKDTVYSLSIWDRTRPGVAVKTRSLRQEFPQGAISAFVPLLYCGNDYCIWQSYQDNHFYLWKHAGDEEPFSLGAPAGNLLIHQIKESPADPNLLAFISTESTVYDRNAQSNNSQESSSSFQLASLHPPVLPLLKKLRRDYGVANVSAEEIVDTTHVGLFQVYNMSDKSSIQQQAGGDGQDGVTEINNSPTTTTTTTTTSTTTTTLRLCGDIMVCKSETYIGDRDTTPREEFRGYTHKPQLEWLSDGNHLAYNDRKVMKVLCVNDDEKRGGHPHHHQKIITTVKPDSFHQRSLDLANQRLHGLFDKLDIDASIQEFNFSPDGNYVGVKIEVCAEETLYVRRGYGPNRVTSSHYRILHWNPFVTLD